MKVIVLDGPMRGQELVLRDQAVLVGSDFSAHVRLPLDPLVAPFHCELRAQGLQCWVEDLGSARGTQVLGKPPARRTPLVPGEVVQVGNTRLLVVIDATDRYQALAGYPEIGGAEAPGGPRAGAAPEEGARERPTVVLVVDDDLDFLLYVRTILEHKGYTVVTASDGMQAMAEVRARVPDIVVCDIHMPGMDGFTLLSRLREDRRLALVPVIVLTGLSAQDVPARGFRMGADDCLTKDRIGELELRIASALQRRARLEEALRAQTGAEAERSARGMIGSLDQVSVPSLLTFLQMERKSGVLLLRRTAATEVARLFLRDGSVVSALVERADGPRGAAAVYAVLDWSEGSFEFLPGPVELEDEVKADTMHLLMEGARLKDERDRGAPGGASAWIDE